MPKDIHAKLEQVQQAVSAPKGQSNKFGGYAYRSLEDINAAVKKPLKDAKAGITLSDELMQVGDRYYIKASAAFYDAESDAEPIVSTGYARETESRKGMDVAQVTGSASSYARKYALCGLLLIDGEKDPDSMDNSQQPASKPQPQPQPQQQQGLTPAKQAEMQHEAQRLADGTNNSLDDCKLSIIKACGNPTQSVKTQAEWKAYITKVKAFVTKTINAMNGDN